MPRKKTWTLKRVVEKRPSAAAVWLALYEMKLQRGNSLVTPTRDELAKRTGLCKKTISSCLTRLHTAGWIERTKIPKQNPDGFVTLLRIVVHDPFTTSSNSSSSAATKPKSSNRNRKGRSVTPTSGTAVAGVELPDSKGNQRVADFPTGRSGPDAATLSLADRPREEQRSMRDDEDENLNLIVPAANSSSLNPPPSQPVSPELQAVIDAIGSADASDAGNEDEEGAAA